MNLDGALKFALGALLGVLGTFIPWRLKRGHERRELWARYALEMTKLHLEAQQHEADATRQTVTVLAPTKLFREIFRAFEEFDRTGEWLERSRQEGILNVFHVAPKAVAPKSEDASSTETPTQPISSNDCRPDPAILMDVLLQEERQYREEMARHESRLIGVGLTYISGLVAATAWLAAMLLDKAPVIVQPLMHPPFLPPSLIETSYLALEELSRGLFFYVLVGVPIVTAVLTFIGARAWASIRERVQLLRQVADDAQRVLQPVQTNPPIRAVRFSSGAAVEGTAARRVLEQGLALYWGLLVQGLSVVLIYWTSEFVDGRPLRLWYWLLALLGTIAGGYALGHLIYRDFQRLRLLRTIRNPPSA